MTKTLVLLAHGSRDQTANDAVRALARRLSRETGAPRIDAAFLELAAPQLAEVVAGQVDEGATAIVVLPLFIHRGRHVREDLPALIQQLQHRYPSVHFEAADPIGADEAFVALVRSRARAAIQS